jgi:tetratricopeptide (TPR) repeat protein
MFRRYFLPLLASIVFVFSTSLLVAAQSGQVLGHITLKQADGTSVPAADAQVDIFRMDLPGDFNLKANKKGDFVHAGLPIQGNYTVSVSMPGAQPYFLPNVRSGGAEEIKIELAPGDGKRLTRADIKMIMTRTPGAAPPPGKESSDDKAKREEILKKNAEIEASNKRAESSNAVIDRTFKAGNDALRAKNYDLAIAQYDEGLSADPEHPGAPALLTNRTVALSARAVDRYNIAVKSADDAAKAAGMEAARKDWQAASESGAKAVTMLKAMPVPADVAAANAAKLNLYFALQARADATRLFVVKVDPTKVAQGVTAYEEYIAAEADPVKKTQAQNALAQMLFDANAFDQALVQYQKILETSPDDLNALLRSGQSLFNIGALNNGDKIKYQEAANYLAKYVEKAPDTDPYKADAKAILDTLKDQANVKPEKLAAPVRRTKRP